MSLFLVLLALGCGSAGGARSHCDPFAAHAQPIALGVILGAGKDSQGTTYVADETKDVGEHVFVSNGKLLVRQRVAGSGGIGSSLYVFDVEDHDPAFTLEIDTSDRAHIRMGLVVGPLETKTFTIGEQGEELSLVPSAEIKAMSLRNLPGEVVLEFADRLKDGRLLVVTRPLDDWSYDDFRVFLGAKEQVLERRLISASRGNDTYITFDLDGAEVQAFFPVVVTDAGMFEPGTPTLTIDKTSQDLVALDARPAGALYQCFEP